jgi:cytochrome P450 family 6
MYFYFTRNFNLWKELGIPSVKPLPFVGNLKEVVLLKATLGKCLQKMYDDHSDKSYVGIFVFDQPSLMIRDLNLVKNILVKDAQNFIDRTVYADKKLDPLFGRMLPVIKGKRWRQLRLNLTPVFTSSKMKMMFYLMEVCCNELVKYLDMATNDGKSSKATKCQVPSHNPCSKHTFTDLGFRLAKGRKIKVFIHIKLSSRIFRTLIFQPFL